MGAFRADLTPVAQTPSGPGGSTASGSAYLVRVGDRLTGVIYAQGLSPNLPHAMHVHGVAQSAAERLGELHIVIHGSDLNGNGVYDGVTSSLSTLVGANVPLEAELPVACGPIQPLTAGKPAAAGRCAGGFIGPADAGRGRPTMRPWPASPATRWSTSPGWPGST